MIEIKPGLGSKDTENRVPIHFEVTFCPPDTSLRLYMPWSDHPGVKNQFLGVTF